MKEHKAKEQHIQKRNGAEKKRKKEKPEDGQSQLRIDNLFVPSTNIPAEETNDEEEDDDSSDHDDNDGDDNYEDDDDDDGEWELCKLPNKIYRQ